MRRRDLGMQRLMVSLQHASPGLRRFLRGYRAEAAKCTLNLTSRPVIEEEEMDPGERIIDTREDDPRATEPRRDVPPTEPTRDVPPTEPRPGEVPPTTEPVEPEEVPPTTEPLPGDIPPTEPLPGDIPPTEPAREPRDVPPAEPRRGL